MNRYGFVGLLVILILFLTLGVIYSIVTPAFEASDEISHYPFVQHVASGQGLPVQEPGVQTAWRQEGSQPPLYYLLMAGLTTWIETDDLEGPLRYNPHAQVGVPNAVGNKNMMLHAAAHQWPYRGSVLAVHVIRWASLLLQCATVVFAFLIARKLHPNHVAVPLLGAALVAFNPMFLFISASVNNDNLIVPLCSAGVWLLLIVVQRGFTWVRVVVVGMLCGLAALTKLSGLAFSGLAGAAILVIALRRREPVWIWRSGLCIVAGITLIAGWWYLRNLRLYGDPLGLSVMLQIAGVRAAPHGLAAVFGEIRGFFMSFWGVFGGFNVLAPTWVYRVFAALTAAGFLGLALASATRRVRVRMEHLLLTVWLLILVGSLLRWTSMTLASQGRLIFPGITAVAALLAAGLVAWAPSHVQRWLAAGWASLALAAAVASPVLAIAPAYEWAPLVSEANVPADARPLLASFDDNLLLIGYRLEPRALTEGSRLWVSLYWKALRPMSVDYSVFVKLFDSAHRQVGALDTYPGLGSRPTSTLAPGDVVADRYAIDVTGDIVELSACDVEVGAYDLRTMTSLTARDPTGQKVGRVVLSGSKLVPPYPPTYTPGIATPFRFDRKVALAGYDVEPAPALPGQQVSLTLFWRVEVTLGGDYTVFVHMLDGSGRAIAFADGVPSGGGYPTSLWDAGESVADRHILRIPQDAPPGTYSVGVGLYRPNDGVRLSALDEAGVALPDGMAVLTAAIKVVSP